MKVRTYLMVGKPRAVVFGDDMVATSSTRGNLGRKGQDRGSWGYRAGRGPMFIREDEAHHVRGVEAGSHRVGPSPTDGRR